MNRNSLLKTLRNVFAAPAPYTSRFDGVDPKVMPLLSTRYV